MGDCVGLIVGRVDVVVVDEAVSDPDSVGTESVFVGAAVGLCFLGRFVGASVGIASVASS